MGQNQNNFGGLFGFLFGAPLSSSASPPGSLPLFNRKALDTKRAIRFANAIFLATSRVSQKQDTYGRTSSVVIAGVASAMTGSGNVDIRSSGIVTNRYSKTPSTVLRPDGRGVDANGNETYSFTGIKGATWRPSNATFSPLLWLAASSLTASEGAAIADWPDNFVTSLTASASPTFPHYSTNLYGINGRAAVQYSNASAPNSGVLSSPLTGGFTVAMVLRQLITIGITRTLLTLGNCDNVGHASSSLSVGLIAGNFLSVADRSGTQFATAGTNMLGPLTSSAIALVFSGSGGGIEAYVGGTRVTIGQPLNSFSVTGSVPFYVGQLHSGTTNAGPSSASIGELIIFRGILPRSDISNVFSYFSLKYGI